MEARKLATVRELIRRHPAPVTAGTGDQLAGGTRELPDSWDDHLEREVSLQLGMSVVGARKLIYLAWALEARIPRIGDALAGGLTPGKVKMIVDETDVLTDPGHLTRAEEMILAGLSRCKTWMELLRLVQRSVAAVDPEGARKRREQAEREHARVEFWRETSGACGLSGRELPPDEALAARAHIEARAQEYRAVGVKRYIDILRVAAFSDILNAVPAAERIAQFKAEDAARDAAARSGPAKATPAGNAAAENAAADTAGAGSTGGAGNGDAGDERTRKGSGNGQDQGDARDSGTTSAAVDSAPGKRQAASGSRSSQDDGPWDDAAEDPAARDDADWDDSAVDDGTWDDAAGDPVAWNGKSGDDQAGDIDQAGDGVAGDQGPGNDGPPGGHWTSGGPGGPASRSFAARTNLTLSALDIPLLTALGLARRPGEARGLGALDPCLARKLAEAAARDSRSQFCVTIVNDHGHAIGHGCCKLTRDKRRASQTDSQPDSADLPRNGTAGTAGVAGKGPPRTTCYPGARTFGGFTFTPSGSPGPPGGFGQWILALPCETQTSEGRVFTVDLHPVPTGECDHRYESPGHDPTGLLRHLVHVRDGTCGFPTCSRQARESDFEHAVPFEKGGRTCGCNGWACSRSCHQVKQSDDWKVTEIKPGWIQWTAPSGRVHTQEPWRYWC